MRPGVSMLSKSSNSNCELQGILKANTSKFKTTTCLQIKQRPRELEAFRKKKLLGEFINEKNTKNMRQF